MMLRLVVVALVLVIVVVVVWELLESFLARTSMLSTDRGDIVEVTLDANASVGVGLGVVWEGNEADSMLLLVDMTSLVLVGSLGLIGARRLRCSKMKC